MPTSYFKLSTIFAKTVLADSDFFQLKKVEVGANPNIRKRLLPIKAQFRLPPEKMLFFRRLQLRNCCSYVLYTLHSSLLVLQKVSVYQASFWCVRPQHQFYNSKRSYHQQNKLLIIKNLNTQKIQPWYTMLGPRINTEERAKIVAAIWGTDLIQFLAALAICTRTN